MSNKLKALILFLVVGLPLALSVTSTRAAEAEKYEAPSNQELSAYRTNVSSDDPDDFSASGVATITTLITEGCPTFMVNCRFSTSGASATITILRGDVTEAGTYAIHGRNSLTAQAHATFTDGTDYMSQDLFFDTGGSPNAKILIHDISAGSVDVWLTRTYDGS